MKLSQYGYDFTPDMLAKYPAENRDEARLMVVNINSLNAALSTTLSLSPDERRMKKWAPLRNDFAKNFALFLQGARSWLLARRLADTLADSAPGMLPRELLVDQRRALFGSPMFGGGLSEQLLDMLETLV